MIKKIAGIYGIVIGLAITGLWTMLLLTDQVPELATAPISITFHIVAEMVMAGLLIVAGVGLFLKMKWSLPLYTMSSGLVIYSVINSSGYYAQNGDFLMVVMFSILLILTVIILKKSWK